MSKEDAGMKEPKVNRLFAAIVIVHILLSIGLTLWGSFVGTIQLPLVLSLTLGEWTLFVPTAFYVWICKPDLRRLCPGWKLRIAVIPLLIVMAYCLIPFVSLINLISMVIGGENAALSLLEPIQRLPIWVSLLCISVLPGVLEEFIFRGLLYSEYRKRSVWGAILLSALLFGLMHMNFNQLCYAFALGVILALVYEATGSLLAPMLLHAVFNANSVIMSYVADSSAIQAAGSQADMMEQMFGGMAGLQMLITLVLIAILALIGLAAAGGLYTAIVKLSHREEHVKLLFGRHAMERRAALEGGEITEQPETPVSRKLWGIFLWIGVILAAAFILWELLALKLT